jgi:hypothetical protein
MYFYENIKWAIKKFWVEVLYCNSRTYGNAYLITFTVQPLHTHTHTLGPTALPLLEALTEVFFFWNFPEFGRHILFDALHRCKTCPLRPIFRLGNSKMSLRARSVMYGGWAKTGMFFLSEKMLHKQCIAWSKNHRPCHFLQTASCNLRKTCTQKRPVTHCPGGTIVNVKELGELYDSLSYILVITYTII